MPKDRDKPLTITIEQEQLVIRIGISTLAFAFDHSEENNPWNDEKNDFVRSFKVTNKKEFANDVLITLREEKEDGSTLLTDLLDKACNTAVENGSRGVRECR